LFFIIGKSSGVDGLAEDVVLFLKLQCEEVEVTVFSSVLCDVDYVRLLPF
jgi:hypothetical protein